MIKITSETTLDKKPLTLDNEMCPDDGVYKVLGSSDNNVSHVLIIGESVVFSDGITLTHTSHYEELEYSYVLEPCKCDILFTN